MTTKNDTRDSNRLRLLWVILGIVVGILIAPVVRPFLPGEIIELPYLEPSQIKLTLLSPNLLLDELNSKLVQKSKEGIFLTPQQFYRHLLLKIANAERALDKGAQGSSYLDIADRIVYAATAERFFIGLLKHTEVGNSNDGSTVIDTLITKTPDERKASAIDLNASFERFFWSD